MQLNLIGKKAWPIDNSNQYNIQNGERSNLAGNAYGDEPQMVTIVSEPYMVKYEFMGKEYEDEFVTILFNGNLYICHNCFHFSLEDAMDSHESFINSTERY